MTSMTCYCGFSYGTYGFATASAFDVAPAYDSASACDVPCGGFTSQTCGGASSTNSIYWSKSNYLVLTSYSAKTKIKRELIQNTNTFVATQIYFGIGLR